MRTLSIERLSGHPDLLFELLPLLASQLIAITNKIFTNLRVLCDTLPVLTLSGASGKVARLLAAMATKGGHDRDSPFSITIVSLASGPTQLMLTSCIFWL
jgi:hypothetical protein